MRLSTTLRIIWLKCGKVLQITKNRHERVVFVVCAGVPLLCLIPIKILERTYTLRPTELRLTMVSNVGLVTFVIRRGLRKQTGAVVRLSYHIQFCQMICYFLCQISIIGSPIDGSLDWKRISLFTKQKTSALAPVQSWCGDGPL